MLRLPSAPALVFAATLPFLAGCSEEPPKPLRETGNFAHPLDDSLRINHLQAEATHNSYHVAGDNAPDFWRYTHAPLDVQLSSQGVRGVELDVHWNASAGAYDVYHLPLVDDRTTCAVFTECLGVLLAWSDAHPGHHPIFVQIEPKGGFTKEEVLLERFDRLDTEIRSVIPPELLITPDEVRGAHATLAEAIATDGWPTLGEARGRFLFSFDCSRELCLLYAGGEQGVAEGRVLFPDSRMGDPFAGFMVINDPSVEARAAVEAGYLVRVFAEDFTGVLNGEPDELAAALASGAHVISTDAPAPIDGLAYFVEMPGGTPSRCNPVTAPSSCTSLDIEDPARLTGAPVD